jgi:hypothetical protein
MAPRRCLRVALARRVCADKAGSDGSSAERDVVGKAKIKTANRMMIESFFIVPELPLVERL